MLSGRYAAGLAAFTHTKAGRAHFVGLNTAALAELAEAQGRLATARRAYTSALKLFEATGDGEAIADGRELLGLLLMRIGNKARGRVLVQACLAYHRRHKHNQKVQEIQQKRRALE
jgi:hypothetical protein